MNITIVYRCDNCGTNFTRRCGIPDELYNGDLGHGCQGNSVAVGIEDMRASYSCRECGHVTFAELATLIPASAQAMHGCGRMCRAT